MALDHEVIVGYSEDDYLNDPYLGGTNGVHLPCQFEVVIADTLKPTPAQYEAKIESTKALPAQFEAVLDDKTKAMPAQFTHTFADQTKDMPAQFEVQVVHLKPTNAQFLKGNLIHRQCFGYLEDDYLEGAYLAERLCVALPAQFEVLINGVKNMPAQFEAKIVDSIKDMPAQFEVTIADALKALGAQFNASITKLLGAQFQVVLYNITQLRILCTFLSRGLPVAQGGSGGQNWTATIGGLPITKAGDFSPNNMNTDIVEQRWESQAGAISNVNLDVDTEIAQGVTIDTLAILDHNISPGGTLILQGSNVPTFAVINTTITLPIEEENIFYIAPTFPTAVDQNRYWRFNVNDPLNSDNYLRIGTIIFGNAIIMSEANCMTDKIKRTTVHFADRVRTEGFTTVSNDRAIKRKIDLRFQDIQYGLGDFAKLDDIFRTARTSLKCLWVPVPQIPSRFAVFGKVTQLPSEEHNVKSRVNTDMDLITFNITVDESF